MRYFNPFTGSLGLSLVLALALIGCDAADPSGGANAPGSTARPGTQGVNAVFDTDASDGDVDLIAGQNTDVGDVTWTRDNGNLVITYIIDAGWCALEYHLDAGTLDGDGNIVGIPMNNGGNPQIGNFAYGDDDLGCVDMIEVIVPLDEVEGWVEGGSVIVAAHAVVTDGINEEDCGFIYGIEAATGDIYRIFLDDNSSTLAFDTVIDPPAANFGPNSLALDLSNSRLYFTNWVSGTGSDPIYFWDLDTNTQVLAGDLGLGAAIFNATATFANGTYYYTPSVSNDNLYAATFNADGSLNTTTLVCEDFAGGDAFDLRYGDYAYRAEDGLIYGNARIGGGGIPATFFTLDPNTCDYNVINDDTLLLQLAFDCEGDLIAHSTNTGEFYVVDRATGDLTPLGSVDGRLFNDLAPGDVCCEPGDEETAWGGGMNFPGNNWAMYFEFTP